MTVTPRLVHGARRVAGRLRGRAGPAGWLVHQLDRWRAHRQPTGDTRIEQGLAAFAACYPTATVVVVGANDGIKRDPVRPYLLTRDWTTYLLEPVPAVHAQLCRNTRWIPGATPVQLAIADREGELPFHTVRAPEPGESTWPWYDALGSFDREVVASHHDLIPDIEERIVTTRVRATTFPRFLAEYGIVHLDLLLVDTEGHDLDVLVQVDLDALAPAMVVYEHHHLGEARRREAERLLQASGYRTVSEGLDTMAVRTSDDRPAHPALLAACGPHVR